MTNTVSAINALKAKKNKNGFTLMEMLIVVAIIAILVAIAIPVFNTQLTDARDAVTKANERSASSMAVAYYLEKDYNATGEQTYYYGVDGNNNMVKVDSATTDATYKTVYTVKITGGKVTSVTE